MMQENMTTKTLALASVSAAAALAAYDQACAGGGVDRDVAQAAHLLAAALRKPKAAKPKADGFTAAFLAALSRCCDVIERRNSIPILANVKLIAGGGTVVFMATDLDIETVIEVRGYDGPAFHVTVEAHALKSLLRGAKELAFTPPDAAGRLGVTVDGAVANLPTRRVDDFPVMKFHEGKTAEIPARVLGEMLEFLAPFVSEEETRYYLNGVYVHAIVDQGRKLLRGVSTDGSRLAIDAFELGPKGWDIAPMILPRKTVDLLRKALGEGGVAVEYAEERTVETGKTSHGEPVHGKLGPLVRFVFADGSRLTSKLIDGNYPDYQRVIPRPDKPSTVAIADPKAFREALARLASISAEKSRSVRLTFEGDALRGRVRNLECADISATLPAVCARRRGAPDEFSFNANYLGALIAEPGELRLGAPNDPAGFHVAGRPDRLAILMPLRT